MSDLNQPEICSGKVVKICNLLINKISIIIVHLHANLITTKYVCKCSSAGQSQTKTGRGLSQNYFIIIHIQIF